MNNAKYIDTKNYNNSQPSMQETLMIPDTELGIVDNEMAEMNVQEKEIVTAMQAYEEDTGRRFPIEEGELLKALGGSGDINPETGLRRYQNKLAQIGTAATTTAGMLTGGAAATTGVYLGPAGIVLMVGGILKGAYDEGKANVKKMKELGKGIDEINAKRVELGERAREDIANLWEGVGTKLSDIRSGIGEAFETVSGKVSEVVQKGRGLATGAAEQIVAETSTDVQDKLTRDTENLQDITELSIDEYSRKMEDETESMTREVQDMFAEKSALSKKTEWYQNIV